MVAASSGAEGHDLPLHSDQQEREGRGYPIYGVSRMSLWRVLSHRFPCAISTPPLMTRWRNCPPRWSPRLRVPVSTSACRQSDAVYSVDRVRQSSTVIAVHASWKGRTCSTCFYHLLRNPSAASSRSFAFSASSCNIVCGHSVSL